MIAHNKPGHAAIKKRAKVLSVAKRAAAGADLGKHNNGRTTGFNAVERSATKAGYSPAVAEKIAGAQYQRMRMKGML